jgi:AraC-like DNA-binding protein
VLIPARATPGAPGSWAWPAGLIVWGRGDFAATHAHHAVQIVVPLHGHLRVRPSRRSRWRRADAVIVRPNAPHEVDPPPTTVLIAFVDPQSALAASILSKAPQPITLVAAAAVRRWRRVTGGPHTVTESRVRAWIVGEFDNGAGRPAIDPRVSSVVRMLRARHGDLGNTSLAHLASAARLSPSRFGHLFTASIGLPLRRYVLWLRLQRAVAGLAAGQSVTDAAHLAGFADAAHLSRTFRRMLGCPPRELVRRQKRVREVHVGEAH